MKGDAERCLAAGMNDYLSKPMGPELLEAKVLHWLRVVLKHKDAGDVREERATDEMEGLVEPLIWDKESLMLRVRNKELIS